MNNICYSGGASGADTAFGHHSLLAKHDLIHYSFSGHFNFKNHPQQKYFKVLSTLELLEADPILKEANKHILKRRFPTSHVYMDNLLRRNYYQVKDTDTIYAISQIDHDLNIVIGGTGWAVSMGIILGIPKIYVFDQIEFQWYEWNVVKWSKMNGDPPRPMGKYTGIGSRELTKTGEEAIQKLYS